MKSLPILTSLTYETDQSLFDYLTRVLSTTLWADSKKQVRVTVAEAVGAMAYAEDFCVRVFRRRQYSALAKMAMVFPDAEVDRLLAVLWEVCRAAEHAGGCAFATNVESAICVGSGEEAGTGS